MKKVYTIAIVAAMLVATGCQSSKTPAAWSGYKPTRPAPKPVYPRTWLKDTGTGRAQFQRTGIPATADTARFWTAAY